MPRTPGYQLIEGCRTRLTGLTQNEAESLFLTGLPGPAHELGLESVAALARTYSPGRSPREPA